MKKCIFLLNLGVAIALCLSPKTLVAQDVNLGGPMVFTRGSGFVLRLEGCNGLSSNFGYQINPHVCMSVGIGFDTYVDGSDLGFGVNSSPGARFYTSDKPWSPFFDFRFFSEYADGFLVVGYKALGGVSYKDFDFGAGFAYCTLVDYIEYVMLPSLTISYNIRTFKHR